MNLSERTSVYGLGQQLGGINKRGRKYESYCTDDPHHTEDKTTLYGSHNFFLVLDDQANGFYLDFAGRVAYDIGYTDESLLTIKVFGTDFDLYQFKPDTPEAVVTEFRKIIGKPYMPPKWAFGYFQSRWGYSSEKDLLEVKDAFSKNDLPLEGIYVDIDYMERFKDFSVNKETYPDFKGLVNTFKKDNQYLVPIIDAGVKIEKGYDVYEQGLKGDHFVKGDDGKPYTAAVWPGHVHFPDFLRPETREWFGDLYKYLINQGIVGIWNDMNEPAIFYDDKKLGQAIKKAKDSEGKNLDIHTYFELGDVFRNLSNHQDYYDTMIHSYEGKEYSNDEVHNLYGYFMTQSAFEGFEKHLPGIRPLILSRASHIGMHRYGGIWTGDNASWWSHLETNVKQMSSLSMVGFLYSGADTGGFGANTSAQLLSRWLQFSVFTPLLRNHSAIGTRNQEPYQFSEEATSINRELIKVRYRLLPFIYSEYLKAVTDDKMLFKPLTFAYDDERVGDIEDQIMLGDHVMLVPVVKHNQRGRMVYLPEDMMLVSMDSKDIELKVYEKGDHYLSYDLDKVMFFLKKDAMIPIIESVNNTKETEDKDITWIGYATKKASYRLMDDDGVHKTQTAKTLIDRVVTIDLAGKTLGDTFILLGENSRLDIRDKDK
nr:MULTISPECIES: TIM-barrel domain-containing protein [unclassified Fusibacter]